MAQDTADFTNYDVGAGIAINVNRFVGIEGEFSGAFGIENQFGLGSGTSGTGVRGC